MPQMSPMYWTLMLFYSILILMFIMFICYFFYKPMISSDKYLFKMNNYDKFW